MSDQRCCCWVTKSCPALSNPMDCGIPGFLNHLILCLPLLLCLQFFPESGSFPMSWLFASGGQSYEASASAPVLPNIQGWFPLRLTGLISLQSKGLLSIFSSITVQKHPFFSTQPYYGPNPYMTTGKTIDLTKQTFISKVMSLLCNTLSRFVIAFLPSIF